MKIKRSVLVGIIREEFANHIREQLFAEKPKDDDEKDLSVVDAEAEKKGKEKPGGKGEESPTKPQGGPVNPTQASDKKGAPKELPVADEPEADQELEKDVADPEDEEDEEDAEDVTGGKIADEISGKTVQSITMEPKSKLLPGAMEIAITFREIPDPLKILVTKTGQVKFHFRGIHNSL